MKTLRLTDEQFDSIVKSLEDMCDFRDDCDGCPWVSQEEHGGCDMEKVEWRRNPNDNP